MSKKYIIELDFYIGFAILFVVLIHANAAYFIDYQLSKYTVTGTLFNTINLEDYPNLLFGVTFNIIDKIIHIAVPMFIFAAGYKYAINNKSENYSEYLFKKVRQVFKPFLVISLIISFILLTKMILIENIGFLEVIYEFIKGLIKIFLGYNYAYQLWYVPMYLFIVLTYPIIDKIIKNDKIRMLLFVCLALMWILAELYLPIVKIYPYPLSFIYYFYLFELGVTVCIKGIKFGKYLTLIYTLSLIISVVLPVYLNSLITELIIIPIGVLALFNITREIVDSKILLTLSKYSFYIFLFHEPFFVSWTLSTLQSLGMKNYFIVVGLATLVAILCSLIVTNILANIPGLSRLLNLSSFSYEKTKGIISK